MRTYYSSDKKRREDAKRKQQEAKRLKRQNRNTAGSADKQPADAPAGAEAPVTGVSDQEKGQ